jgi:hypothetical protein
VAEKVIYWFERRELKGKYAAIHGHPALKIIGICPNNILNNEVKL